MSQHWARVRLAAGCIGMLGSAWWAGADDRALIGDFLKAGAPGVFTRSEAIGLSRQGREIRLLRVTKTAEGLGGEKPAVLVVAGINAMHMVGTDVAWGVALEIAAAHADVLEHADLYVIPALNPDGEARFIASGFRDGLGAAAGGEVNPRGNDRDRDLRRGENPAQDLNGDGLITLMRLKDPRPDLGLEATEIADADEPRLIHRADGIKGEKGVYVVLPESLDLDGDGKYGEDGWGLPGGSRGVDLDMNFPYQWPEFDDDAGPTPLSEPESLALVRWVLETPRIVAVVTYAPADNLVKAPDGATGSRAGEGKMDHTGKIPVAGAVLAGDKPVYELVGKAFIERTKMTGTGWPAAGGRGSFTGWAAAHAGVLAFQTPVWVRPDLVKQDEAKKDESKKDEAKQDEPASGPVPVDAPKPEEGKKAASPGGKKKSDATEDSKWLAYADQRAKLAALPGFVPWTAFEHPTLGSVEIGGFAPAFKYSAPDEDRPRLVKEQAGFLADLMGRVPRLSVRGPFVTRLGESVWRVSLSIVNEGGLATRTKMGVETDRLPPTRAVIGLDRSKVAAGESTQSAKSIEAGGVLNVEWTVIGGEGEPVRISVLSPECGDRTLDVTLNAGARP